MVYRSYLLAVLMVIVAFSYVDRMAFGLALQGIKEDLLLSDTQLGLLTGVVFALFFAVAGIPIARWADRGNRVAIVSLTTAVWSVMVALCGIVTGFGQMLLVRIGTAVGEAGCQPPANSLIPEYFSRTERARANARYVMGSGLGVIAGFFAGGWLIQLYGWRKAFIIIGLPGLLLAAVALFTLKEPRNRAGKTSLEVEVTPSLRQVISILWASPTLRHLLVFFIVWYFAGWGLAQWLPTFFIRSHGMETGALGSWLAIVSGGGVMLGTWLGGECASRYAAGNERKQLAGSALVFALVAVIGVATFMAPTRFTAFFALAALQISSAMVSGPVFGSIQTLVPAHARATALTLVCTFPIFLGMGFGPWAVGAMSDALQPQAGNEALRYALVAVCPAFLWAAWHAWRASRTIGQELANSALQSQNSPR